MAVLFGVSQINQDAPVLYKRIESAVVIVLIPGFTAFVMSMSIDPTLQKELIAGAVFFGAVIKAVGVGLGQAVDTLVTSSSITTTTTNTVTPPPESKN